MNTPIYDFLMRYSNSNMLRCHMPGHKGKAQANCIPDELFQMDITEVCGADSLFEANGIIAESERNMARLYETAATVYSAGGSTLCIQTMLAIMKQENRRVFAIRNVHRAFLNAAALLGIDVEWILPEYSGSILSGEINIDSIDSALKKSNKPSCLYITSPDYTGKMADIAALSEICHKYGAVLLVDNAHGAHLAFFEKSIHPIALGADLCCDSAHKMLPALTGAALLHTSSENYAKQLKSSMSLFASTSPSYPIMASLDTCTTYINKQIRNDICKNITYINNFKSFFENRLVFADGEPFHITVKAAESGFCGNELAQILRKNGVECEYSDNELLILLMSPANNSADYRRLTEAMKIAIESAHEYSSASECFSMTLPEKSMSIRDAVFSPSEEIDIDDSLDRVCAAVKVPCPPAIPIVASGEIINAECINIFKKYGISQINVVK